ncbi:MAG: peptidase, partial [Thaumarchaeota archaeon]|nr:peptidase [Nitrososphaerota archaeon]
MSFDIFSQNAIFYVLIAWVVILGITKVLKLEKHGFEVKPYSLTYKNAQVQTVLTKILGRTRRGIRIFADVSVVAGFIMMGFGFWFLIDNITKFFDKPADFSQLTVLIPGVT